MTGETANREEYLRLKELLFREEQQSLRAVEAHLGGHETRLGEHEVRLGGHEAHLAVHEARLGGHETRLSEHETHLSEHETRLGGHEARLGRHGTRLAGHNARLGDHEAHFGRHGARLAVHDTRLGEHETRLGEHHELFGTPDRFQARVAEIMPASVREACAGQPGALAAALSPAVLDALRQALARAPGEVSAILHPIMGRLIRAYAASAASTALERLNDQLKNLLTGRFLRLRLKSLVSGIPYAALVKAETEPFRADALFLIRRGSGILVDSWHAAPEARDATNGNARAVDALLAEIAAFARAIPEGDSGIHSFHTDGAAVYLCASPEYVAAAHCTGKQTASMERKLGAEMRAILEQYSGALAQAERVIDGSVSRAVLPVLAARLAYLQEREKPRSTLAKAFLILLLLAGAGWIAAELVHGARTRALEAQAARAVAGFGELKGYPVRVTISPGGREALISGVVPSDEAGQRAAVKVAEVLGAIPLRSELTPVRAGEMAHGGGEEIAALKMQIAALRQVLEESAARFDAGFNQNRTSLQRIEAKLDSPQMALTHWLRANAIFFTEQRSFRDPAAASRQLDELSRLLTATGAKIRVVGYTDPAGSPGVNVPLAVARANHVVSELVRRNVDAGQLKALGRPNGALVSGDQGPGSNNRRVEFEQLFEGEAVQDRGVPVAAGGG